MPECIEKLRLIESHKAAIDTALALDARIGMMPVGEHSKLIRAIEMARAMAGHARDALSAHIDEHGC